MSCVKYVRSQCQWRMCHLEHPSPSNFYVSCWQSNRSAAPLLLFRTFLFLFSTCVLLTSMAAVPLTLNKNFGYWFIYLSHWGFLLIVLTAAFSTSVSAYVYFKKPIDATFGLPWYVKTYWILYNITIPVAFLITVFYWGILRTSVNTVNFAPNPVLDVMLHGVNSGVMLVELLCSAHPSRLLHIMQPLYFAGAYMLFSVIYYFAGGLDPWGNPFIYPVVDWSKPEQTMVVITLTALFLALMHLLVVGIAAARDAIAKRREDVPTGVYNDAFAP
ncbi:protein rolling stone-like isoform X1 [Trichoplusia ni]|uniref:Protein rolling stone-like isoform X1 n=1 Tax=Trichoplusia ni TaxID=7111 RepID=A0A7E5WDJ8_TRINI|nr:protein rolling stone-like isoform X1 [Trichoplusia ni]